MKNYDIINLVNCGVLVITANDIEASHAYKVLKFKKAVRKAYEAIIDSDKAFLEEVGITDPEAFDKERKEATDPARIAEMGKTARRLFELRKARDNEDAALEGVKTIPYEVFHALQKENKDIQGKPLNAFEDILEGVLWEAQEEE